MDIYLVGGAVRDKLLGRTVTERDYVVVGATPAQMLDQGYRQVGKDFPVFLHPETHDEYALARTERKTAPGYHGFEVHADPSVTLKDDLLRRDLTINALAEDSDGRIVDYYGGQADLEARVLRHVSPAFAEDPVRILRVARFAARYAALGFGVAPETQALMSEMVRAGEADALVAERVWQELDKTLNEPRPARFFEVLRECGALERLFPEIDRLFGVPQRADYHPEIDTGVHTLMVLDQAARLTTDKPTRFAALVHDLGKGTTSPELWPSHPDHEARGLEPVAAMCERLRAPSAYKALGRITTAYHGHVHRAAELEAPALLEVLEACDAFRRPERFEHMLIACEADSRGRSGFEDTPYPQADRFRSVLAAARGVDIEPLRRRALKGEAMASAIRTLRLEAIGRVLEALNAA